MKASKIAEGDDASKPKKEEEESEEDGRVENKEKKAETAERSSSRKEEGVATPEAEEEGVVPPGNEKQGKPQEGSQETRRSRQQNRRKKISEEKLMMKNGADEKQVSWVGMVHSEYYPQSVCEHEGIDEENYETSSGNSFKENPWESASDEESKIVRNPVAIKLIESNTEGNNTYTVVVHVKKNEHVTHLFH